MLTCGCINGKEFLVHYGLQVDVVILPRISVNIAKKRPRKGGTIYRG